MTKYTSTKVKERLQKLQNQDHVSEENAQQMEEFLRKLRVQDDTSASRNYKYMYTFDTMFKRYIDFPLMSATKEDIEEAVYKINYHKDFYDEPEGGLSDYTKADYKICLGKFYRTMFDDEVDRPKRIQKILKSDLLKKSNSKIKRKKEIEALTPEEVMNMVENARNPRNRLLPLFMLESGARISELLGIKLKDVVLTKQYAEVTITTLKNTKEPRTLTLTKCIGLLQDWMEKHPRSDQPDAPLMVNLTNKYWKNKAKTEKDYMGKGMTATNTQVVLRKLADRAGIDKYISNHVMRHSSATYWGKEFGLETMMYWFGWQSSDTATTYLHHDQEQVKKLRLSSEGIDEELNKDHLESSVCPRCEEKQPPTAKYCSQCSMSLDQEAAQRIKQLEEAGENIAREKLEGISDEEIKKMVSG